ncbi:hypothetical protein MGA5115_02577 [Marinomonas gallaica]|uniref:Outer membrane protein beta-barrel domain-containing protein n=1 Tax=Marinomonas gallaica TaxID=1806667 RepID=A0A1C3JTM7_9GAMM|nr:hypothetical protein [Marinomonas gallaica]SBT18446.1 hypothetical protein MGA5115_02577 [Marinomonas gallaica]SBT22648.1 hypothetical protein MGA5116_03271 [Marinomonas gallaica]
MKKIISVVGLSLCANAAVAATETVENNVSTLLFEASAGADYSQFGLGIGIKPENNRSGFGGLYYEQVELKHRFETDIKTLGFRGFSVEGVGEEARGADITMGLSKTVSGDYKRTGFSARGLLHMPLFVNTTWFVGGDVRPTFLSFDWDNDALTELALQIGVDTRLAKNIGLYAKYYHESLILDDFEEHRLGSGFVAGINVVW